MTKEEKKIADVMFFPNGNTAVFISGQQSAKHQKSWFLEFVNFLKQNEVDVENSTFRMPDGRIARIFKIKYGYNWEFI